MISISRTKAVTLFIMIMLQPLIASFMLNVGGASFFPIIELSQKAGDVRAYSIAIAATKEGATEPMKMLSVKDLAELERQQVSNEAALKEINTDLKLSSDNHLMTVRGIFGLEVLFALIAIWILTSKPSRKDDSTPQNSDLNITTAS